MPGSGGPSCHESCGAVAAMKIIVVGDASVGKTSVLSRFLHGPAGPAAASEHGPTIGVDFGIKVVKVRGRPVKLQIWDTAGLEMYRSIASAYFRKAAGCIAMYDLTNARSFESLKRWADDVYGAAPSARIVVVGNKKDLESGRRVKATTAMDFADLIKADYTETSAMDGRSVELMFDLLATRIYDEHLAVCANGAVGPATEMPEGITLLGTSILGAAKPTGLTGSCSCV